MKQFFMLALIVPAFIGSFVACSNAKATARQSGEKMTVQQLEGKWNIVEVRGEKVTARNTPFMEFDMKENKLHGNAGCNIFNNAVSVDEKDASAFSIAEGMTTMMACPDMDTERKILHSLESVKGVKAGAKADEARLVDAEGNVVFLLKK